MKDTQTPPPSVPKATSEIFWAFVTLFQGLFMSIASFNSLLWLDLPQGHAAGAFPQTALVIGLITALCAAAYLLFRFGVFAKKTITENL